MNKTYRPNVIPAQMLISSVIPAEAGIQRCVTGFRVKPGMTVHLRCVLTELNKGESNG